MAERSGFRIPVAIVVLVMGALLLVPLLPGGSGKRGTGVSGSSLATTPEGAKAAYLLLGRLGHTVERRLEPLGALEDSQLAFLLTPTARLDRVDGEGLTDWIEEGGTLVYGVSAFEPDGEALREKLGLEGLVVLPTPQRKVVLDKEWAPAHTLVVRVTAQPDLAQTRKSESPTLAALARDPEDQDPVALTVPRKNGRIYVVDARVFSNAGLKEADNALFLAALAARHAGGAPIVFDEFAHEYGNVNSVLGTIAWPLQAAFVVAALALLLYALALGRRLGAISPDPAPPRRASTEQVEALAAFYASKRDRHTALLALAEAAGDVSRAPLVAPNNDGALIAEAHKLRPSPRAPAHATKGTSWP